MKTVKNAKPAHSRECVRPLYQKSVKSLSSNQRHAEKKTNSKGPPTMFLVSVLHLWWNHLFIRCLLPHTAASVYSPLFALCKRAREVDPIWNGMRTKQSFVRLPLTAAYFQSGLRAMGGGGRNKPWRVASPSPRSLAVGVSDLNELVCGCRRGDNLLLERCQGPRESNLEPPCHVLHVKKKTQMALFGSPSLPFSVQTESLSGQRRLSWLTDWFPMTKFARPPSNGVCCWHDSRSGGGSQATAEKGGWAAWKGELTHRKLPQFSSV